MLTETIDFKVAPVSNPMTSELVVSGFRKTKHRWDCSEDEKYYL